MKEQTHFHIPTPCHEDWDNMTTEGKGRFCASCSKQVVDFSLMSDQQVLNYFKTAAGKVCGRFANDQLQRPMIEAPKQKKKVWWIAAMMPLFLFARKEDKKSIQGEAVSVVLDTTSPSPILMGKITAPIQPKIDTLVTVEDGITMGTPVMVVPEIINSPTDEILPDASIDSFVTMGDVEIKSDSAKTIEDTVLISNEKDEYILKGTVIDKENNDPISYATVRVQGTNKFTTTDSSGSFSLRITETDKHGKLVISSVGYSIEEVSIDASNWNDIELDRKDNVLPDIIVTAGKLITCSRMTSGEVMVMGGVTLGKKITIVDSLKSTAKNILKISDFKSYPNPIVRGNILKLEIAKPGEYSLQVIDNSAKLILTKDITTASDKSVAEITIPSSLAAGMYYIRLIDNNKKKQYTDKLIVQ